MNQTPKFAVRIDNVYFLKQLGTSLRDATANVPLEELPEDIRLALRRLERRERLQSIVKGRPDRNPPT